MALIPLELLTAGDPARVVEVVQVVEAAGPEFSERTGTTFRPGTWPLVLEWK